MNRWVWGRRTVTGRPDRLKDALIQSTPELLQVATDTPVSPPAGDGTFHMQLYGRAAGLPLTKRVRAQVGEVHRTAHWLSIPVSWEADPGRHLLPAFRGTLELEDRSDSIVDLVVVGEYDPPVQPVGALAAASGMRQTVEGTVQWLAERLGRALVDEVYGEAQPAELPAGAMLVRDIMTPDPLVLVEDMSLRTAAALLRRVGISGAAVIDDDGLVIGVLSERDLLDKASDPVSRHGRAKREADRRRAATTVGAACSRPARTTAADATVRSAAAEMVRQDVDRLIVMDGADHVGIVTRSDVLEALARAQEDLLDAVADVLAAMGVEEVDVHVDAGTVTLGGEVMTRSLRQAVVDRIASVDGVLGVDDSDLRWVSDDLLRTSAPL